MKKLSALGVFGLLIVFLSSCGSSYKTPFRRDTIYTTPPLEKKVLGDQGEGFSKRGDYLSDKGLLKPEPGESYAAFYDRLVNLLVVQSFDKEAYNELIKKREGSIKGLEVQLKMLREKNNDLRTDYNALQDRKDYGSLQRYVFEPYRVVKGDTLQKIAERAYGTYTAWVAIYHFNQFYLKSPNSIEVGDLLWLPAFNNI